MSSVLDLGAPKISCRHRLTKKVLCWRLHVIGGAGENATPSAFELHVLLMVFGFEA